ncbi:hypothetical protein [Chroococcus sp. FPU101]|uniref:hypothetical protein n=1 Tax=Chroococcus sp. FPU101 TaxID=1974212 RepID=UPI001A8D01DA|nr:hypothetical protein [Chroococcus sp. FPU101]GFE72159.1 hypothetical protein CFPU101_47690 [Chroococcus sp. FPU101]
MKNLLIGTGLLFALATPAFADDTLTIPVDFALARVIKLDVTQSGVAIALDAPIQSIKLTHMRDITFSTLDGVLCETPANCPEGNAPTLLLVQKTKPIPFKDQLPTPNGTTMLYVNTSRGLYRFQLRPVSKKPDYTKVEFKQSAIYKPL